MAFASSINTGLQQTPDLTDIQSVGKLSFQFISIYNAIQALQQAIDNYTGNAPATPTTSTSPATPESTILVGNTANMWCVANANINAGYLVNLFNSSGVTKAQLADAAITGTYPAMGISMNNASAGGNLQVLLLGLFNFGGSVTPGAVYYLSDAVAGGITVTPPTTGSGHLLQPVGFGVDTNSMWFNPDLRNILA
jgi:hypothetical protein